MRRILILTLLLPALILPVSALELYPPEVPRSGAALMPEDTDNFGQALGELLEEALRNVFPDLTEALGLGAALVCGGLVTGLLRTLPGVPALAETVLLSTALLGNADAMIRLGALTVTELGDYGKLLLPVLTAALAAQGFPAASAVLYAGSAGFSAVLSQLISGLLMPLVWAFLALSVADCALDQSLLKKLGDFLKWLITWLLKLLMTVFTVYLSVTGIVSGTTDAVALKAAKLTISTAVPVVGGILSDASEAVLVSAGIMKNAAGIYGILAAIAVFLSPFLKIGTHYLVLKASAALCGLVASRNAARLVENFSAAMGFLLAMTGCTCLMLLISTVCFLKGAG